MRVYFLIDESDCDNILGVYSTLEKATNAYKERMRELCDEYGYEEYNEVENIYIIKSTEVDGKYSGWLIKESVDYGGIIKKILNEINS